MKFPLKLFRISGHSMEPALKAGSFVLVWTWQSRYHVGHIIAFFRDDKIFIKRISKINGNQFIVTGDNPKDSHDSRDFGTIDKGNLIGKVIWY